MHSVVSRDTDQVLIEGAMVDRAETQPVANQRLTALLGVTHDVRCLEEPTLPESTNRAKTAISDEDSSAETCLVEANARLPYGIATLKGILDWNRLWLVERANHPAGRYQYTPSGRIVMDDKTGVERLVPARPGCDEIDDRHAKRLRGAKGSIVWLIYRACAVGVQETVFDLFVAVGAGHVPSSGVRR
jgi:hypothetical protein